MKRAFSLVELLIVVMIIGVVYTLAISNFQKISDKSSKVTLQTLKSYLQSFPHEKEVRFLCLDDCSSCNIFVDDKKVKELETIFDGFVDDSIVVYRYEFLTGAHEILQDVYFNEEGVEDRVCFSYRVDTKGVGDQVLIQ